MAYAAGVLRAQGAFGMNNTIAFILDDDFNKRKVEFKTTLGGDSIDAYYEAFESFLLAVGFVQNSIDRRYEQ